ncbi:MAG TPA: DUF4388 domain-containing protein [Polyangia bacterium]|jgi:hypothetical protein
MREDEATVVIHEDGYVTAEDLAAARRLASRAGRWHMIPAPPTIIMLQRDYEPGGDPGRVALAGDVAACGGLLDVINLVKNCSWSGALSAMHRSTRRTIYFRKGEVRTASSNLPEDRLGQILYRFGIITREQLEQALHAMGAGAKMGQVLVGMGAITAPDLYRWVKRQVEEIFYALLLTREGEFYFERDGKEPPGANLSLPTQNLLLEGCRRMDELSYFRAKLTSSGVVLGRRKGITVPPDLTHAQHELLDLVDGRRTLEDLARQTHLGEFDATHAAFGLLQANLVEVQEAAQRQKDAPVASRADLEKVVGTVNWLLRSAHEMIAARGYAERYREDLTAYLQTLVLFSSLACEPDGTLPVGTVIDKITAATKDDPLLALLQSLDELVRFAVFTAGDDLPAEAEREMRARIGEIVRGVGRDLGNDASGRIAVG